jgi:hypothetical protein
MTIDRGRRRHPIQCVERALEVARFSRERTQLLEPSVYLLADAIDEVRHGRQH